MRPSILHLLLPLKLALATALAIDVASAEEERPNIVFIITDDQRADWLGAAGHSTLKTPHIDRLAAEGALFNRFFVSCPLCSPSRASFLTGLYPHTHKVVNNDKLGLDVISHTLMTFPRRLRESGYETAFIGKWHMGLDDSRRPGFDHWISFKGQGLYLDPVVNENGQRRQLTGYMTDYLNQQAVEFVKQPRAKPFLLCLSHKAVHAPYLPAPRHAELYSDLEPKLPAASEADLAGKPALRLNRIKPPLYLIEGVAPEPGQSRRGRGGDAKSIIRDQMRSLTSVDEGVGLIVNALAEQGRLDDTLIIFTSDNGYLLGEHGRFNDKRLAYEESIRVPLVMRYPPLIRPGTKIDALTLNVDVAPTLLEVAGAAPVTAMHGSSLAPLLKNPDAEWRDSILTEYFLEKVVPNARPWQSVRTQRWKYIRYADLEGMDELYDLEADPRELSNRINDPQVESVLEDLRDRLAALLSATS